MQKQTKTTTFLSLRIVGDNIDREITARVQTKQHSNRSLHWTHQFALLDKVSDNHLDKEESQKRVQELEYQQLLPDSGVQQNLILQWAVIVSRIVTKYIPAFKVFQRNVIYHIPHPYAKEMSTKLDMVSSFPTNL